MTSTSPGALPVLSRRSALATAAGLFAAGALAACGSATPASHPTASGGSSPASDEPIANNFLETTAENQAATYRHIDRQKLGTRVIRRDPTRISPLPRSGKSLKDLHYTYNGADRTIAQYVADNRCSGLLVLKDGAIVHEQYAMGNTETTRWTSMSIAKSVTATLIGTALADKAIGSLDDPVARYVPELRDSAYKENTIRQLLMMSSGVQWSDGDVTIKGDSPLARMFQAVYANQPGGVMDVVRHLPRAYPPGSQFFYNTGDSYVLATIVARATGQTCSDYLSKKIWQPLGMEADAYWMLDAPGGQELGGSCIQATLRDYARFGQFILTGGDGVLPKGWRDQAGNPSAPGSDSYYGYQWWTISPTPTPIPAFFGAGINGQRLYIIPDENVVIVNWGAWREPLGSKAPENKEFKSVVDATVKALH
ncbi:serine hydrolase domain-containing protein [Nocardia xishanensis]